MLPYFFSILDDKYKAKAMTSNKQNKARKRKYRFHGNRYTKLEEVNETSETANSETL